MNEDLQIFWILLILQPSVLVLTWNATNAIALSALMPLLALSTGACLAYRCSHCMLDSYSPFANMSIAMDHTISRMSSMTAEDRSCIFHTEAKRNEPASNHD